MPHIGLSAAYACLRDIKNSLVYQHANADAEPTQRIPISSSGLNTCVCVRACVVCVCSHLILVRQQRDTSDV